MTASFAEAMAAYEGWMGAQLGADLVTGDLDRKHAKMREGAFAFLRATYFRWAETVLEACPELAATTPVVAVGDVHLENFGTWRDVEGRLVWGVNDFDEAAEMPFTLDLVRLATSALVGAAPDGVGVAKICEGLLAGYASGLAAPGAIVLDRDWAQLRERMVVTDTQRAKFWAKMLKAKAAKAPAPYLAALRKAMPDAAIVPETTPRTAGLGSLGRPRWVGRAEWCGGPVLREAKAVLLSAWYLAQAPRRRTRHLASVAAGPYRSPDPWFAVDGDIAVRRLSPNNRKIDADDPSYARIGVELLQAMGRELASIHLGTDGAKAAINRDLGRLPKAWLATAATTMAAAVEADFKAYARS